MQSHEEAEWKERERGRRGGGGSEAKVHHVAAKEGERGG